MKNFIWFSIDNRKTFWHNKLPFFNWRDFKMSETLTETKTKTRQNIPLSQKTLLTQAKRVSGLLEQCGDTERQSKILKILLESLELSE